MKQQLITTRDELLDTFGEPTSGSYKDVLSAIGYLKYGNKLWCTRAMPTSASFAGTYGDFEAAADFDAFNQNTAYILDDIDSDDPDDWADYAFDAARGDTSANMSFIANSRGAWGNNIKIGVIGKTQYDLVAAGETSSLSTLLEADVEEIDIPLEADMSSTSTSASTEFVVIVSVQDQGETSYDVKETWHVSTNETKVDDEGTNIYCEKRINEHSHFIRIALTSALKNADVNQMYTADYETFAGGQDCDGDPSDSVIEDAFDLYENDEEIDVNLFIDSDKSTNVKSYLIAICEERKDCMAILDCLQDDVVNERGSEASNLRSYRRGDDAELFNENTSYAALYGNWLNIYDRWNSVYRWVPPSGHMAGIYANTDDVTDPWFAPAGLNRSILTNVRKLAWNPTKGNRDILYKNGINPIVSFAGQGKVVWGQKTLLDKSSAFNRVNVRRLFIVLEKAISTAAKYFLFEPNDAFTRLLLVNMIEPFLRDVKARRGIYDYLVVCDDRNNTPERIDRNELWADLYIKPVRAVEYLVLNFIATRTGASFTELVAATLPET